MGIYLFLAVTRICLDVSWPQPVITVQQLLFTEAQSRLAFDMLVRSDRCKQDFLGTLSILSDCPSMGYKSGGTVNISDAFESYGLSVMFDNGSQVLIPF